MPARRVDDLGRFGGNVEHRTCRERKPRDDVADRLVERAYECAKFVLALDAQAILQLFAFRRKQLRLPGREFERVECAIGIVQQFLAFDQKHSGFAFGGRGFRRRMFARASCVIGLAKERLDANRHPEEDAAFDDDDERVKEDSPEPFLRKHRAR